MGLVKPKKFLGQHFLKDLSIAKDIADTVDVCPDLPIGSRTGDGGTNPVYYAEQPYGKSGGTGL